MDEREYANKETLGAKTRRLSGEKAKRKGKEKRQREKAKRKGKEKRQREKPQACKA
jgi:hypothetical protein